MCLCPGSFCISTSRSSSLSADEVDNSEGTGLYSVHARNVPVYVGRRSVAVFDTTQANELSVTLRGYYRTEYGLEFTLW